MTYLSPLPDPVTSSFVVVIVVVFLFAFFGRIRRKEVHLSTLERFIPNSLVTLGVIGTFLGIYVGLDGFDIRDVDGSIPMLLAGLRTSFVTSIFGMVTSILLRFIQSVLRPKFQNHTDEAVTAKDLLDILNNIHSEAKTNRAQQEQLFQSLKKAITGDDDSSLITQIQRFRTSNHDDLDGLSKDLKSFSEKVAEDNSKALIEALEKVIRDFNTKINEQFGENFKELNKAVGGLLTWQEKYKTHVEGLTADFDEVRNGITQTKDAVVEISKQCNAIPQTMGDLKQVVLIIDQQTISLNEHLAAIAGLRDKALAAFPVIEDNIYKLTTEFSQKITEQLTMIQEVMSKQKDMIEGVVDKNKQTMDDATREHKEAAELLKKESKNLADSLRSALTETNEIIEKSFTEFDKQMQSEMKRSIETMGCHLASLSDKFVKDYTPLTERLKDLLASVSGNQHGRKKAVTVEVRPSRTFEHNEAGRIKAVSSVTPAATEQKKPAPAKAKSPERRSGQKPSGQDILTDAEREKRRTLENFGEAFLGAARKADEERKILEEQQQVEEQARAASTAEERVRRDADKGI